MWYGRAGRVGDVNPGAGTAAPPGFRSWRAGGVVVELC
ncbi:hypothetical protein K377_00784 [Streptomyces sp. PsTaAH-137]|nr:hypothetical protein K377_00784 [Streptomyces sp. PsTaAH-137]